MNFQPGDVVVLKSGGPPMTVKSVGNSGDVFVVWFSTANGLNEFKQAGMLGITLQHADGRQAVGSSHEGERHEHY